MLIMYIYIHTNIICHVKANQFVKQYLLLESWQALDVPSLYCSLFVFMHPAHIIAHTCTYRSVEARAASVCECCLHSEQSAIDTVHTQMHVIMMIQCRIC